jgi:hypothetical protein
MVNTSEVFSILNDPAVDRRAASFKRIVLIGAADRSLADEYDEGLR